MADNVEITEGSGVTVHADEYNHTTLGSGKTQLMKLVDGVLNSDTPITVDVGAKANALRVAPANDITDETYIGNVKVTSSASLMPQWFNAVFDSADASAEANVVKAKTEARKIYILSLTISVDAEMWVKLQDEDSNPLTCKHWFKAGGGKTITYPPEAPLVLNVVNKDLEVITEGAGNIGVEVTGYLAV